MILLLVYRYIIVLYMGIKKPMLLFVPSEEQNKLGYTYQAQYR